MHRRPDDLIEDAMIAAAAIVHNLTVVTGNVRDFKPLGVDTLDPFRRGRALTGGESPEPRRQRT